MQTAAQSFGMHAYTQLQEASLFNNRRDTDATAQQSSESGLPAAPDDSVTLSATGIKLSQKSAKPITPADQKGTDQKPLSQEELMRLAELKTRDDEVRAHEQAHLSAAGEYATGGATFSYTTGPNGKRYASAGKVPIDTSPEDTPEATIQKMRTIRRAALAPANPSAADRAIAAQTSSKEMQAMREMQEMDTKMSTKLSGSVINTETPEGKNVDKSASAPKVSGYSRATMASAYQAMAALAA